VRSFRVYVKNEGESEIELPEIGGYSLQPDEEIEMTASGRYGQDYQAVMRALTELTGTVLYQQREAGTLSYRIEPRLGD